MAEVRTTHTHTHKGNTMRNRDNQHKIDAMIIEADNREGANWSYCQCVDCGGDAPVALHHAPVDRRAFENIVGDGESGFDFWHDTHRFL